MSLSEQAELEVRYLEVELISASGLPSLSKDSEGQVRPAFIEPMLHFDCQS